MKAGERRLNNESEIFIFRVFADPDFGQRVQKFNGKPRNFELGFRSHGKWRRILTFYVKKKKKGEGTAKEKKSFFPFDFFCH